MWKKRKIKKTGTPTFQWMNPNAAGVDVGAMEIYIAVPADRDPQPVRCFSTFTEDLHAAADWLKASKIETTSSVTRLASNNCVNAPLISRRRGPRRSAG